MFEFAVVVYYVCKLLFSMCCCFKMNLEQFIYSFYFGKMNYGDDYATLKIVMSDEVMEKTVSLALRNAGKILV